MYSISITLSGLSIGTCLFFKKILKKKSIFCSQIYNWFKWNAIWFCVIWLNFSECCYEDEIPYLYPHAKGILEALKEKGIHVAVASRSPAPDIAKTFLHKLGIHSMFVPMVRLSCCIMCIIFFLFFFSISAFILFVDLFCFMYAAAYVGCDLYVYKRLIKCIFFWKHLRYFPFSPKTVLQYFYVPTSDDWNVSK